VGIPHHTKDGKIPTTFYSLGDITEFRECSTEVHDMTTYLSSIRRRHCPTVDERKASTPSLSRTTANIQDNRVRERRSSMDIPEHRQIAACLRADTCG
jgi:hypothetical protein